MDGAGDVYAVNTFGAQGLASRHAIGGGTALYTFDERGNATRLKQKPPGLFLGRAAFLPVQCRRGDSNPYEVAPKGF